MILHYLAILYYPPLGILLSSVGFRAILCMVKCVAHLARDAAKLVFGKGRLETTRLGKKLKMLDRERKVVGGRKVVIKK